MTSTPAGNTPDQGADRSADRKPREVRGDDLAKAIGDTNDRAAEIISGLRKRLATQDARIKELEAALEPFQSGKWGAVKAWIVNGAPSRDQGIAAARLLTKHQYRVDEVLAALKTEAR